MVITPFIFGFRENCVEEQRKPIQLPLQWCQNEPKVSIWSKDMQIWNLSLKSDLYPFFCLSPINDHNRQCSHYLRLIALLEMKDVGMTWVALSKKAQDRDVWRMFVCGLYPDRGERQWWWWIALLVRKKEFIWLCISENSLKKYELENILSQNKIYGTPKSQRR